MPTRRDALRRIGLASAAALVEPGFAAAQSSAFEGGQAGEPRVIEDVRLRWCPPGRFTMGSPPTETDRRADEDAGRRHAHPRLLDGGVRDDAGAVAADRRRVPRQAADRGVRARRGFPALLGQLRGSGRLLPRADRAGQARIGHPGERRVPPADGGAVGVRLPRRHDHRDRLRRSRAPRRRQLQDRSAARWRRPAVAGTRHAGRRLPRQRLGPPRHVRQRLRMVPRLVSRHAAGRRRSRRAGEGRAEPRRQLLAGPPRRARGTTKRTGAAPRCACATSRSATPITSGSASSSSPSERPRLYRRTADARGCARPAESGLHVPGAARPAHDRLRARRDHEPAGDAAGRADRAAGAGRADRRVRPPDRRVRRRRHQGDRAGRGDVRVRDPVLRRDDRRRAARSDRRRRAARGRPAPDPHRGRLGAAGAGRAPGRLRRGDVPRDGAGGAAALRSPRARSPRAGLRRVARRGRELPAVDGTGAARLRGAADPDRDAVRAADPRAGGGPRVRVHGRLVPGPARRPAARRPRSTRARPLPRRAS